MVWYRREKQIRNNIDKNIKRRCVIYKIKNNSFFICTLNNLYHFKRNNSSFIVLFNISIDYKCLNYHITHIYILY